MTTTSATITTTISANNNNHNICDCGPSLLDTHRFLAWQCAAVSPIADR